MTYHVIRQWLCLDTHLCCWICWAPYAEPFKRSKRNRTISGMGERNGNASQASAARCTRMVAGSLTVANKQTNKHTNRHTQAQCLQTWTGFVFRHLGPTQMATTAAPLNSSCACAKMQRRSSKETRDGHWQVVLHIGSLLELYIPGGFVLVFVTSWSLCFGGAAWPTKQVAPAAATATCYLLLVIQSYWWDWCPWQLWIWVCIR